MGVELLACEKSAPDLPPKPRKASSGVDSPLPDLKGDSDLTAKPKLSEATLREVAQLRNRTLRFTPRDEPIGKLAFFGNRVGRMTRQGLTIATLYPAQLPSQSEGSFKGPAIGTVPVKHPYQRIPLQEPREIVPLADDSLLMLGKSESVLLWSDDRRPIRLNKFPYFPGMRLWPELRWPGRFTTFLASQGTFALYKWSPDDRGRAEPSSGSSVRLPTTLLDVPELQDAICSLLRDGSYACVKDAWLYHGFPGHPPKRLGPIAIGADIVRLLPAFRADFVRVLRADARLEDYFVVSPPKAVGSIVLPWVPFDVVSAGHRLLVLRLLQGSAGVSQFELVRIDDKGHSIWTVDLGSIDSSESADQFDRDVHGCRSLAVHPTKPLLATSDCEGVRVFDDGTGREVMRLENVPY